MKYGICGGSYDPVHLGHLHLWKESINNLDLDFLFIIPTFISPFKSTTYFSNAHRKKIINLAIKDFYEENKTKAKLVLIDYEIKRKETSYTINTINYLYEKYNFETKPYLIMGSDSYSNFDSWYESKLIREKTKITVINRDNICFDDKNIIFLNIKPFNCSSTCFNKTKDLSLLSKSVKTFLTSFSYFKDLAKKEETDKRFSHSMDVVKSSLYINKYYNLNLKIKDIKIAAILHDFARSWSLQELNLYVKENNIKIFKEEENSILLHAVVASNIFSNLVNKDIELAIRYHSLGSKDMTRLAALIYCSDFLNLGRSYISEEEYYKILNDCKTLEELVLYITKVCIEYQKEKNNIIAQTTLKMIEYLEKGNCFE